VKTIGDANLVLDSQLSDRDDDASFLRRAARIAVRGHGGAEPNPMVGCVLVDRSGAVIAEGFHRRCGEAHAEAMALARASTRARGATAYVTLEPCTHHGRTPPCADALISAGVARVVYASHDPNPLAHGGAAKLEAAGIAVELRSCRECDLLNEPFLKRCRSGLPWVMAKWAQSIDGKIATRTGDSRWISGQRSRRMVHRERGRVDAILTGFGTARRDDPQLTTHGARGRRVATRVVVDPELELPVNLNVFSTAAPTIVATLPELAGTATARGMRVAALGPQGELRPLLEHLARQCGVANVLVEAGGGLLGQLLRENLLDEAFVFVTPLVIGDEDALDPIRGLTPLAIGDAQRWRTIAVRQRGDDALLQLRRR
jgi:diaminohydroxyphosphoribosylaminopyrimidine deaminase/5-amino-6-(5-phosphoribosylamino)uracil reductase